jgi:dsRNA-specific ribonuclease
LNNFYNKNDETKNPTKEDILEKLNSAIKIDDYELVIKNIIDDLSESKILEGTLDQKLTALKTALKEMGTMLKMQVSLVPRIEYTVESNLTDIVKEFKESNTDFI